VLAADRGVDEAGVDRERRDAAPRGATGQLAHEQLVRQLRLLVRAQPDVHARVGDPIRVERHAVVRVGAHHDDP